MSLWRSLYGAAWWLATPWVKRYLRRRARQAPAYLEHWDERFALGLAPRASGAIWVHAVSVGETRAAQPLVAELRRRWPDQPLLMTQMTPTGRDAARALYPDAEVVYLAYDRPDMVARWLDAYRPAFGVLMETELWPNLLHACAERGLPLFLANARLSEKSLRGYQKVGGLIRPALSCLAGVAAQTQDDEQRLFELGAPQIRVCGNTKYDVTPAPAQLALGEDFRRRIGARRVLVAASTRDGEEALLLDAWRRAAPDALLVIVPRHPERFDVVARQAQERGFRVARRSDDAPLAPGTQVWLGDSMGELVAYYAAADLAFIGGSLLPLGGQNLIEAAAVGLPLLFGPSMFNFQQASELALATGAARQLPDADAVVAAAQALLADDGARAAMSQAARAFSAQHRGASRRTVDFIAERLSR